ncbi:MAG: hypothetical protein LQ346_003354 [Caloplaca aetnensis]|nr:MAG: hypothetical protein LQ346_003354 [Caloplaca aetnensis]
MSSTPRYIPTFSAEIAYHRTVTQRPVAGPQNLPSDIKDAIDAEDASLFTFCGATAHGPFSASSTMPSMTKGNGNKNMPLHDLILAEIVKEWEAHSYEGRASRTAKEVVYTDVEIVMEAWTRGRGLEGTLVAAVGGDIGHHVGAEDEVEDAVRRDRMSKRREYMRLFLRAHQRKAWADLERYLQNLGEETLMVEGDFDEEGDGRTHW